MTAEEYALAAGLRQYCLEHRLHILKWLFIKSMSERWRRAITEKQGKYLRQMAGWYGITGEHNDAPF
jgi:hypothetical protein